MNTSTTTPAAGCPSGVTTWTVSVAAVTAGDASAPIHANSQARAAGRLLVDPQRVEAITAAPP
jgi:hypothetical protein